MAFSLFINSTRYTRQQLQGLSAGEVAKADPDGLVLPFVQSWLNGEETFTVQTSGSTGEPKPIVLSRQRMQASARLTLQALDIQPGEEALLCINANYIGGRMMLVRAMEGELPVWVVPPAADPLQALPALANPAFGALVPLQLQAILANSKSLTRLNKLKAVIVGGAAISPALEEQSQQVTAPLYSTYGMTETVSHIALRRINGQERQDYFQVLPHVEISIDSRGCLQIEGPMTEGLVVTNDMVELLDRKRFRWLGRVDNVINSGGIKVQAEQLEAVAEEILRSMGHPRRVMAGGLPDERLGQKVALLIEGTSLRQAEEQQIIGLLQQQLPAYWAPREILYLPVFVESNNGKIKRYESWAQLR